MDDVRDEDINRFEQSLFALRKQIGSEWHFIKSVAESLAYQQALVRTYRELLSDYIKAECVRNRR